MSITDELREYAHDCCARVDDAIHAIADRIDAEHERLMRERKGCIHYDQERHYCNVHDLTTDEHYQLLPVDADGVPIRIGDVMEWPDGRTFEVVGIGDGTLFYVESDDADHAEWTGASTKRHHHAPTLEDVLTEFGIDWEHESDCEDRAALLKEYAAKLRLAGDAE